LTDGFLAMKIDFLALDEDEIQISNVTVKRKRWIQSIERAGIF
jgi:hypothetical protein